MSVRSDRDVSRSPVNLLLSWMSRSGFSPRTVEQAIVDARSALDEHDTDRFYDIIAQLVGYLVYERTGVHVRVHTKIYDDGTVNLVVDGREAYRLADDWHVADSLVELQDVIEEIVEDIVYEIRNPSTTRNEPIF